MLRGPAVMMNFGKKGDKQYLNEEQIDNSKYMTKGILKKEDGYKGAPNREELDTCIVWYPGVSDNT